MAAVEQSPARKIWLGASLTMVLALVGFWLAFVRAPGPEQVCDHIIAVTVKEAGAPEGEAGQDLLLRMRQQCISHKRDKIKLRSKLVWARYARCVVASGTLGEIETCG